jgi:hypothetical protein
VEEPLEVLVQHRVQLDMTGERGQLLRGRQLAVDQQVAHLDERRLLGKLLDRDSAVAQDPGIAVDVGDRALARGGVDEAVIERRIPALGQQRTESDAVGALGGVDDLEVQFTTWVLEGGGVVGCGHGNPFAVSADAGPTRLRYS